MSERLMASRGMKIENYYEGGRRETQSQTPS